ncbi:MAG TPA: sigma-70 family RNA polymerase sigma factor [Chthonomonadales bacterium]|nr:sigma-70 family RNA polymerase sigma factor [Chthonomonadales bacterium]
MMSQSDCVALFGANKAIAHLVLNEVLSRHTRRLPALFQAEDLESVALLALWDACRWYNPARGAFSTYAHHAIRRRIRRVLARADSEEPMLSLDAPAVPGESVCLRDILVAPGPDVGEQVIGRIEQEDMRALLDRLPKRTADAIRLWAQGFGPTEIGRRLGISRQRAHQLPREGAALLRRMAMRNISEA